MTLQKEMVSLIVYCYECCMQDNVLVFYLIIDENLITGGEVLNALPV